MFRRRDRTAREWSEGWIPESVALLEDRELKWFIFRLWGRVQLHQATVARTGEHEWLPECWAGSLVFALVYFELESLKDVLAGVPGSTHESGPRRWVPDYSKEDVDYARDVVLGDWADDWYWGFLFNASNYGLLDGQAPPPPSDWFEPIGKFQMEYLFGEPSEIVHARREDQRVAAAPRAEPTFTVPELARLLGVAESTIWSRVKSGALPSPDDEGRRGRGNAARWRAETLANFGIELPQRSELLGDGVSVGEAGEAPT